MQDCSLSSPAPPLLTVDAPAIRTLSSSVSLALLLDYDGTLMPHADDPLAGGPDEALRRLLRDLVGRAGVEVHVVSERDPRILDEWLGQLPVRLHAAHGAVWRGPDSGWSELAAGFDAHLEPVREAMRTYAIRTRGSLIEEKLVGVAWHYRRADPEQGAQAARELCVLLGGLLATAPVEVLVGNRVVEVRPRGINKGLAVGRVRRGAAILAMGDDHTDDDLFAALPAGAIGVAVGGISRNASWRVPSVTAARRVLQEILSIRTRARR
ncbi:MAG: trehalose-phosphatase [Pseudomonadota bacterium]|nr:trehalose-phosphatase [Pseudomonadota bacterium]